MYIFKPFLRAFLTALLYIYICIFSFYFANIFEFKCILGKHHGWLTTNPKIISHFCGCCLDYLYRSFWISCKKINYFHRRNRIIKTGKWLCYNLFEITTFNIIFPYLSIISYSIASLPVVIFHKWHVHMTLIKALSLNLKDILWGKI